VFLGVSAMRNIYYCYIDSPATEIDTNLQLYSLQQAAKHWNDLIDSVEKQGFNNIHRLREKLAFILSCFGLSLIQLLGQNAPSLDKERMDSPMKLLENILGRNNVDQETKKKLANTFSEFLEYYNSLRHFGLNKDEKNYITIDQLTIEKLDSFRHMTINIWDIIISMFKKDKENKIALSSITDDIIFNDLKST
jgi:hypothetical protein